MVGLPSVENREMIFRTLLAKEKVEEGLDFKELATMTDGYTGSDLKVWIWHTWFQMYNWVLLTRCNRLNQNLCTTAAYRPVRELIKQERLKDLVRVVTIFSCYSNASWSNFKVDSTYKLLFAGEKAESFRWERNPIRRREESRKLFRHRRRSGERSNYP